MGCNQFVSIIFFGLVFFLVQPGIDRDNKKYEKKIQKIVTLLVPLG